MQHADKGNATNLDGTGLHIGIVQARFNEGITNALASACRAELAALGVAEQDITHVQVPGALEVPLALQGLAEHADYFIRSPGPDGASSPTPWTRDSVYNTSNGLVTSGDIFYVNFRPSQ